MTTPTSNVRRTARTAALALAGALSLSACEFEGLYGVPLPGGQGQGDDAYEVVAVFDNVLDLVPQSSCRVDDVPVGSVTDVELDGFAARVTCSLNGDVELPSTTVASLRQTSLLGEKFVSLEVPDDVPATGTLEPGAVIPLSQTARNPELEEIFSALSLVLNGGGLQQLTVINRELDAALGGREEKIGEVLRTLDGFVGTLDDQKAAIIRALEGLNRLSTTLNADKEIIGTALEDIPPGLQVLNEERDELIATLQALDRLNGVATRVINASTEATVLNLEALEPILRQLANSGEDFSRALELLFTYPFPRTVDPGIQGDYTNLWVSLQVTSDGLLAFLESELRNASGGGDGSGGEEPAPPGGEEPAPPALPQLPLGTAGAPLDLGSVLGIPRTSDDPAPGSPQPPALPGSGGTSPRPSDDPSPSSPGPAVPALPGSSVQSAGPADLTGLLLGGAA